MREKKKISLLISCSQVSFLSYPEDRSLFFGGEKNTGSVDCRILCRVKRRTLKVWYVVEVCMLNVRTSFFLSWLSQYCNQDYIPLPPLHPYPAGKWKSIFPGTLTTEEKYTQYSNNVEFLYRKV